MSRFKSNEVSYVRWQNRATRFYVAARLCHRQDSFIPAAYCATIALELLLKATLVHFDRSFRATDFRHSGTKLQRALRNKVPGARRITLPDYFFFEHRYIHVSRYPSADRGLTVPSTFIADLDEAFATLLVLTPFQHNTDLKKLLRVAKGPEYRSLSRSNAQIGVVRRFLGIPAPSRGDRR